MPNYLIRQSDWADFFPLGKNVDYLNRVERYVGEAQLHDLRPVLTKDFYTEVLEVAGSGANSANGKLSKADYDLLLPYLKPIIVMYAAARYITMGSAQSTRFGMVNKSNDYSDPLSDSAKKAQAAQLRSNAITHISDLTDFLKDNSTAYPTWYSKQTSTENTIRTGIGIWSV